MARSSRNSGLLKGLSRTLTAFLYVRYLADLAGRESHQRGLAAPRVSARYLVTGVYSNHLMSKCSLYLLCAIASPIACGSRVELDAPTFIAGFGGSSLFGGRSSFGVSGTVGVQATGGADSSNTWSIGGTTLAGTTGNTRLLAKTIAAGNVHTCALIKDGTINCWGSNEFGALGNSSTTSSFVPVAVSGISNATAISAGYYHTCAVLTSGTVRCWGYNVQGQLGNATATDSSVPVTVSGITNATIVAAGDVHTCALLQDGTVQCWGWNQYGQLGNGATGQSSVPVLVSGISKVVAIRQAIHAAERRSR